MWELSVVFGRLFTGVNKGCQAKCLPENDSIVTKTIWHGGLRYKI